MREMRTNLNALLVITVVGILALTTRRYNESTAFSPISLDQATSNQDASVGEQSLANHILSSAKKHFVSGGGKPLLKPEIQKHIIKEVDGFKLDAKASAVMNSNAGQRTHVTSNLRFSAGKNAPDTSLLKRMPSYVARKIISPEARKEMARQKLEAKIASHQLTTRGLVKAVQQAEERHFKELNQDLKDQTDDLIIAKVWFANIFT